MKCKECGQPMDDHDLRSYMGVCELVQCPKGGKHDDHHYDGALGYEAMKCRKCGREVANDPI